MFIFSESSKVKINEHQPESLDYQAWLEKISEDGYTLLAIHPSQSGQYEWQFYHVFGRLRGSDKPPAEG